MRIRFENAKSSAEMQILVFTPNDAKRPAPAFLLHSFGGTKDDARAEHLSAYQTSEVYRLLGKKELTSEASPVIDEAVVVVRPFAPKTLFDQELASKKRLRAPDRRGY